MTPGIHPARVRISTMSTEPHPLSMTAKGGKMTERMTLKTDIGKKMFFFDECDVHLQDVSGSEPEGTGRLLGFPEFGHEPLHDVARRPDGLYGRRDLPDFQLPLFRVAFENAPFRGGFSYDGA